MTVGVNSLLNTGKGALLAFQAAIHVTGENIANVNTPGYSRRTVRLEENPSIDYRPGQIGTGVTAKEVIRHYDYFIERQYLDKSSTMHRWNSLHANLRQVELLFNESIGDGLNDVMAKFWADWQNVSLRPDDMASRGQLTSTAQNMTQIINQLERDLGLFQRQMDDFIRQDVNRANELLREIAVINSKITVHDIPGQNNANALLDKRDSMVRELAGLLDIQTQDKGNGEFFVMTTAGHTLVDGQNFFELKFEGAQAFKSLAVGSSYTGTNNIQFSGTSEREYLVEVLSGGNADGGATYRVSLDGGVTWLKDDNGVQREFTTQLQTNKVTIEGLDIWFDAGDLSAGDKFTIVPKSGLYWYENTSSKMNITPQIHFNGEDNRRRITGGSLTGYFNFRDDYIGNFREKLDTLASTMAWEVNRIHSQGAGLEKFGQVLGTHGVSNQTEPLSSLSSGLFYGDKLQQGNLTVWVYDSAGVPLPQQLTFAGGASPPNFDPATHNLADVEAAFDGLTGIDAEIVDNRLWITATNGNSFAFGSDSTGLLAALGINTFFDGTDARGLSINQDVFNNLSLINVGHVNGAGEINNGDNETAKAIAALQYEKVNFRTTFQGKTSQTLQSFYGSLVGDVGAATSNASFNYSFNKALSDDLRNRQEEISGVNLDEEMSSLIKFQHSYSAAAKLISTADQMFQTILAMK
ncbi:flagellar hook-associated protein FlgK [Desulfonatronum sp. SC1]|uniref:flagellar hook-associated protein FlgK n=1 Tax=Desulfonatronum sp. SC1 TaxID=2109626 RepID=UPI000D2FDA04|nr:flagellar hook-associated protein FlgK [Desulfonatronum sp. SC1]PTN39086.1 flagellar hook-associated protein FlgK [Desulfonatronum sp. SC1]